MDLHEEMREALVEWERSGLSLREFAGREGYTYTKLLYWKRKLRSNGNREIESANSDGSPDRWLPVRVVPGPVPTSGVSGTYEVCLTNGLRVGVRAGFDGAELCRLVQALAAC